MGDRSGQRLGNYYLIRLLGTGGFASVYLAEHIYLKTQAAVKILHAHLAQDEFASFLQEAQTIARLRHPHIVPIFDFGIDNTPFLVMDYLPQGSLRQRHPRGTIVHLDTVASYVNQVAAALQYAHDSKIIHRDVKPENMLINSNNQVVLSDFGIAVTAHQTASLKTMNLSGTPSYMSPEHIAGKPRVASDQYALGMIVYEWLCGKPPFSGEPMAVMYQQTYAPVPPLPFREEDSPSKPYPNNEKTNMIKKAVMRAISKDPQDRFPDVQAFANALTFPAFIETVERRILQYILVELEENRLSEAGLQQTARDFLALFPSYKDEKTLLEGLAVLGKKYKHMELAYLDASKGYEELLRLVDIDIAKRKASQEP